MELMDSNSDNKRDNREYPDYTEDLNQEEARSLSDIEKTIGKLLKPLRNIYECIDPSAKYGRQVPDKLPESVLYDNFKNSGEIKYTPESREIRIIKSPHLNIIHHFGVKIKNGHVVGLGLCREFNHPLTGKKIRYFTEKLLKLPKSIANLKYLEILDLTGNDIVIFTDTFKNLINLKALFLSANNIDTLPQTLLNMPKLEILDVSDNNIFRFPHWFSALPKLKFLNISRNPIANAPEDEITYNLGPVVYLGI